MQRLHRGHSFCHSGHGAPGLNRSDSLGDATCLPQFHVWRKFVHHALELRDVERLRAVADRLRRIRVNFNNETIGADCDGSTRERRNQAALSGGVARVEDHRKMGQFVQHSRRQ